MGDHNKTNNNNFNFYLDLNMLLRNVTFIWIVIYKYIALFFFSYVSFFKYLIINYLYYIINLMFIFDQTFLASS